MINDNPFDILQERGFLAQVTDEAAVRKLLAQEPITFYIGFDSTADSLHAGHLVPIMAMMHMQRAGHRPIGLVGGGTTMVGDPSGKDEMRQMLSEEAIRANGRRIHAQLNHYLHFDEGKAIAANNADWLLDLNYIQFLREIGRHFSVNRMLTAEAYKLRLEKGLSFIEFNYQLLQAYDFLELYRRYGCRMQMGGDDQWSNLLAGVDLIRRVEGATVEVMTYQLLTTASGAKMGKTAAGAVWLEAEKLSPYDYYQYWVNCDDRDVGKLLRTFTFLPLDEIKRLAALEGAELREAKRILAFEATKITHGEPTAREAEETSQSAFRHIIIRDIAVGNDQVDITNGLKGMPTTPISLARLEQGLGVLEIFAEVGLTQSRGEARRLVQQGGIYVNDARIDQAEAMLTAKDITPGGILLRAGKKKYHRLVVEG